MFSSLNLSSPVRSLDVLGESDQFSNYFRYHDGIVVVTGDYYSARNVDVSESNVINR